MQLLYLKKIIIASCFFLTTQPMAFKQLFKKIGLSSGISFITGASLYPSTNNELNRIYASQKVIQQALDDNDTWQNNMMHEGYPIDWENSVYNRLLLIDEKKSLKQKELTFKFIKCLFPFNLALEQLIKHTQK